ncbi:hypothetical protein [Pseudogemmobacter sonorensis]|uniref:hypothetical protein n=1 Tax=Pseudogemmobacter sonorensis TaxID=2989681 RepID=UPI0036BD5226
MKIKALIGMAGPEYVLSPGDERDFPEVEALRLVSAGYAVAVEEKRETATKKPVAEIRPKV